MSNLQGFSLYLCVLFIHLFPAGFRENLCAAARQAVLIQIAFRVGYRSLLANKHSWTEPSHIPASTQIKTGQSWGGVESAPPAEEEQATSTLVGWTSNLPTRGSEGRHPALTSPICHVLKQFAQWWITTKKREKRRKPSRSASDPLVTGWCEAEWI